MIYVSLYDFWLITPRANQISYSWPPESPKNLPAGVGEESQ